jgi:hypothetical protein
MLNPTAERSARRPKQAKLVLNAALRAYVQERLAGLRALVPSPKRSKSPRATLTPEWWMA